jgi:hypothetical protein
MKLFSPGSAHSLLKFNSLSSYSRPTAKMRPRAEATRSLGLGQPSEDWPRRRTATLS